MAHIGQPFRALSLPKISSLNNYATQTSYLQVAGTLTPNSNKINIGISGSSISQYTINPTPKLVHNMAIPSTNVVTAFDAVEDDDKDELWCFALMANKVHSIRLVTISGTADEARGPTLLATPEEGLLKQTVEDKVVSIRIIPSCKCIMVVFECGVIHICDYQLKPVRSMNMSYKDVKFVEHFISDDELYTFVLCDIGNKKTCFKMFKLHQESNTAWLSELNSVILEDFSLNDSIIIHQFGKVYRLSHSKMYIYNLPRFQLACCIQLPFIEADSLVSLKPISTNRVLLTSGNRLMLLDLLHNAILYERELSHIQTFQLLRTAVISGNSTTGNNRTIAIGVSTKHGSNPTSAVDLVTVDVGTGTLKDSLGKGFLSENPNKSQFFKPLFSKADGDHEEKDHMHNFDAIYKELEAKSSSIKSFDAIFTKRLDLKREYYTEGDRYFNNVHFIGKVLDLIFANFSNDFPKALTYLLTHPLFPSTHTGGLLAKFKTHPRLFKQAIVTCPNLPLDELLQELFTVLNEELALDLSLRVLQDFTKDDIKKGIKKMSRIKMNSFIDFIISDSKDLEERQKNKPQLFNLLSLVIDSVGLLGFEEEQLNRLASYIDSQVNLADKAIELLYLLDDSTKSSRKSKTNAATVKPEGESESVERTIPLYSVEYLGA